MYYKNLEGDKIAFINHKERIVESVVNPKILLRELTRIANSSKYSNGRRMIAREFVECVRKHGYITKQVFMLSSNNLTSDYYIG